MRYLGTIFIVIILRVGLSLGAPDTGMAFLEHCTKIVEEEYLDAHIIRGILDAIVVRLEELCGGLVINENVPVIVSGSLYCGDNLNHMLEMLLNLLLRNAERQCQEVKGFTSVWIFT